MTGAGWNRPSRPTCASTTRRLRKRRGSFRTMWTVWCLAGQASWKPQARRIRLVAIAAGSYVRRDDNLLRLVTGRISWKAWRDEDAAIAAWAASRAGLFRDRLASGTGVFAISGALQEAKSSLRDWADRQWALMQQQSAIDPTVKTRLTTCRYDGVVLQCTTS